MAPKRPRPLVLCLIDGVGEREADGANAVRLAKTPVLDRLGATYPRTLLGASGPDVGLPEGRVGDGAVGRASLGAGRIPGLEVSRIDAAVAEGLLGANEIVNRQIRIAKDRKCRLHLFGLVSQGGVHARMEHLYALIQAAHFEEVPVVVHAFLDGQDAPPKTAWEVLGPLEDFLRDREKGVIGTIAGRSFAMDRDGRWDRTEKVFTAIVRGDAPKAESVWDAIQLAYGAGTSEDAIEPVRIGEYDGVGGSFMADFAAKTPEWMWIGEEVGLAFNIRGDGMRQLSAILHRRCVPPEVEEFLTDRKKAVFAFDEHCYATLTEVDPALGLAVAFPRQPLEDSFSEVVARAGLTQLRVAESERRAHATWLVDGGREAPLDGEERVVVPSPRDVRGWDEKPEMSAAAVADEAARAIRAGKHDVVWVDLANADVVAHTGALDATVRAIEAVDEAVGRIEAAVREAGGALIITATHGSAEQMKDDKGRPHPAHTASPVPLLYVNDQDKGATLERGRLADVAPTMLELLGLPIPAAMTGRSLRRG